MRSRFGWHAVQLLAEATATTHRRNHHNRINHAHNHIHHAHNHNRNHTTPVA